MSQTSQQNWVHESKKHNRMLFSELDTLLRALDRFFYAETIPLANEYVSDKDFYPELKAINDVVQRIPVILDAIIPERMRNAYWFSKYTESSLLQESSARSRSHSPVSQETPEDSMYLLYDSFHNLRTIIADILKSSHIQYMSFKNIGQIICKELRENVFFNPFRQEIDYELDSITNRKISQTVRAIKDKEIRKAISIVFLYLFRFLRYMSHVDRSSAKISNLHRGLIIIILLRSEIAVFRLHMEKISMNVQNEELGSLLRDLSYQFMMESKRVYQQELRNVFGIKSLVRMKGRLDNSHGILRNLTEQTVVQLAGHWNENLRGEDVFDAFIARTEQSVKLRNDLYVFHILISKLEKQQTEKNWHAMFIKVMAYIEYFEGVTYKLLRFEDFAEYTTALGRIKAAYKMKKETKVLKDLLHHFNVLLATTLQFIDNRAELKDQPLDIEKAEAIMQEYLQLT